MEYQGEAAYPDTVVKAQPVHAPLVVQRPVHTPIVVSRPVFHSAPLSVAPSSYSPVVHTRVLAHPAIRPLVRASPVVFHPVPSSAANLITSSDDNAGDEQEERKAKEALEVEETKSTIVSEDSVLSTEASQPMTTLAPTTRPTTTQPETTQTPSTQPPPKQPPSGQKTLKRHGYY